MTANTIEPKEVLSVDFILGGDHGKEAFRLCFRVVVTVIGGKFYHKDYGGAGTVFSKKDVPDLLEKTIMDWLTADLKTIHESKLLITKADDASTILCMFVKDDSGGEDPESSHTISKVTIWNTGDLKWMAMLLGMDGMSGEWCIFCYLQKQEWSQDGHEKGRVRTIENVMEFANN